MVGAGDGILGCNEEKDCPPLYPPVGIPLKFDMGCCGCCCGYGDRVGGGDGVLGGYCVGNNDDALYPPVAGIGGVPAPIGIVGDDDGVKIPIISFVQNKIHNI